MTRFSRLILASALTILPISAFAQQNPEPAKTAAPASLTAPTSTMAKPAGAAASAQTAPGKMTAKTSAQPAKTEVHGMDTNTTPHAKANVPVKSTEPAKS